MKSRAEPPQGISIASNKDDSHTLKRDHGLLTLQNQREVEGSLLEGKFKTCFLVKRIYNRFQRGQAKGRAAFRESTTPPSYKVPPPARRALYITRTIQSLPSRIIIYRQYTRSFFYRLIAGDNT